MLLAWSCSFGDESAPTLRAAETRRRQDPISLMGGWRDQRAGRELRLHTMGGPDSPYLPAGEVRRARPWGQGWWGRAGNGCYRAGCGQGLPPNPSLGKPLLANTEKQENKLCFLPGLGKPLGRAWRLLQLQEQDSCSHYSPGKVLGWGTRSILPPCPPHPTPLPRGGLRAEGPSAGSLAPHHTLAWVSNMIV